MSRLTTLAISAAAATFADSAKAHEPEVGGSGFIHAASSADHLTGFMIIGAMSGLYICFNGSQRYVFGSLLALLLLASHDHAPMNGQTGLVFAMGFIGAGLMAALAACELAITLFRKFGLGRRDSRKD